MQLLLLGLLLLGVVSAQEYLNENVTAMTTCKCGRGVQGRIVGGKESTPNAYPYMAALAFSNFVPFCGATIVTNIHAITAAHCTYDLKDRINELHLMVGAHNYTEAVNTQFIPVLKTIEHSGFYMTAFPIHDIAIVVLSARLKPRGDVASVCIQPESINLENKDVLVLGWGRTHNDGTGSQVLSEALLSVISSQVCRLIFPALNRIRTQFCTFIKDRDSCQGDSGGPVLAFDSSIGTYVLVGVTSFGRICNTAPAANTDVGFYFDWIKEAVDETSNSATELCYKIS